MKSKILIPFLVVVVGVLSPRAVLLAQEPLTLTKLESLLRVRAPDSTIAAEVRQRGLAFPVTKEIIQSLRAAGAGQQTSAALNEAISVLDDAKKEIPEVLAAIYADLDQGEVTKASARMTSKVSGNTQVLDGLCRPFTYKAHYIAAMAERPGKRVEVRVRSLFTPLEEHADILEFVRQDGRFLLDAVQHEPDSWLGPMKASAADTARKFAFAAAAGRRDVVEALSAPSLDIRALMQPECLEALAKAKDLSNPRVEFANDKGLKAVVGFGGYGSWGGKAIHVDTIGGKDLVVRFQAPCEIAVVSPRGRVRQQVTAEAPGLQQMTLDRFGLSPAAGAPQIAVLPALGPSNASENGLRGTCIDADTCRQSEADALSSARYGELPTIWDRILDAGASLSWRMCRVGTFSSCKAGTLTLSPKEVSFTDVEGKNEFRVAPNQVASRGVAMPKVLFSSSRVVLLKLTVLGKDLTFNFMPTGVSGCNNSRFFTCPEAGVSQQEAVLTYASNLIPRLKDWRVPAATPTTPTPSASP